MASGNIVTMCDYIASVNTNEAVALCGNYDYTVDETNPEHISDTMVEICGTNGEDALKKVLMIHPDKQVILDAFQKQQSKFNAKGDNGFGCNSCRMMNPAVNEYGRYQSFYATGDSTNAASNSNGTFSNMISMQTNTILILGLLVIGGAIIYKNLKLN